MKIVIAILFALLLSISGAAQVEEQVASIRAEVNLINQTLPKYEKKTKEVESVSTEGAEATYYTSGRGLHKITAKVSGETFRATIDIYYQGEEMVFVYMRLERYKTYIGDTPLKIAATQEKRMYRTGNKTIRFLSGKTELKPGTTEFTDAETELKDFADKLKAAYQP